MEKEGGAGWRFATRCVRSRQESLEGSGALASPIYQTSAFVFESVAAIQRHNAGKGPRYIYSRYANPTLDEVERTMASLESAEEAVLFSSGQAATTAAILSLVRAGDEILSLRTIYGGTYRLFQDLLADLGISARYFNADDVGHLDRLAPPHPCDLRGDSHEPDAGGAGPLQPRRRREPRPDSAWPWTALSPRPTTRTRSFSAPIW